jgi:murein DD-endopeptidase MepM/ murein hydrolase activator NlpD
MKRRQPGGWVIPALALFFCAGIIVGWWLRSGAPLPARAGDAPVAIARLPESSSVRPDTGAEGLAGDAGVIRARDTAATTGEPLVGPAPAPAARVMADLQARNLRLPIDDARVEAMKGGFAERRDNGGRPHEAVDILAPRNTPVHAVEDGMIAKLFFSKAGGITIYQFDPTERFCYYYAHLERYASGLKDGQHVSRGDVIGYVGTTGNAPPNTPHLHFAVFELDQERRWWKGRALDPYLVFTQ